MAEGELQPGSLCQALGLKFNLSFLFVCFLKQTGKEERGERREEGGKGEEGERISCYSCLLSFLFEFSRCFQASMLSIGIDFFRDQ